MKSLLELLYEGQLLPVEQIVPKDPAYRATSQKMTEAMGMWRQRLSEGEYTQLEDLLHLRVETVDMELAASFAYGFKLGAALMIEILNERKA